jgi:hypothetical protein
MITSCCSDTLCWWAFRTATTNCASGIPALAVSLADIEELQRGLKADIEELQRDGS